MRTFPGSSTRAFVTRMKEKKKVEMSDEDKDIDVESDEVSKFYCCAITWILYWQV